MKKSKSAPRYINTHKIAQYNNKATPIIENKPSKQPDIQNSEVFIPKTILNSADPLKLKIRLQPKNSLNASEKSHQKNGNIFDNITSYCNNMKMLNQSVKTPRVRSMDELLNDDDYTNNSDKASSDKNNIIPNDEDNKPIMFHNNRGTIRNVFSAENILKIRRMDHSDKAEWPITRLTTKVVNRSISPDVPGAIPIIAKRVVPVCDQTKIFSNSITFFFIDC